MKQTKVKRILAIIGILFFAGVFISLVINLVKGAPASVILVHLFCLMIIPCIIYGFLLIIRKAKKRSEEGGEE